MRASRTAHFVASRSASASLKCQGLGSATRATYACTSGKSMTAPRPQGNGHLGQLAVEVDGRSPMSEMSSRPPGA